MARPVRRRRPLLNPAPSTRRPRKALLTALALAAAGTLALAHAATVPQHPANPPPAATRPDDRTSTGTVSPAPRTAATPTPPALARPTPATARSTPPPPRPSVASGVPDPYDGDVPDATVQTILQASSPPDLPAALSSELTARARADLAADLAPQPAAAPAATGLHVQAAIARRHQGRTDVVDVTLIYQSDDPAGGAEQHRAVLTYACTTAGWMAADTATPNAAS